MTGAGMTGACVIWAGAACCASPSPGACRGASDGPMYFTTSLCRKYFRPRNRAPHCARRPRRRLPICAGSPRPTMVYSGRARRSPQNRPVAKIPDRSRTRLLEDLVRGHELAGGEATGPSADGPPDAPAAGQDARTADAGPAAACPAQSPVRPGDQPARWLSSRMLGPALGWLSIFAVSLGLFTLRFLVPVPVGMAKRRRRRPADVRQAVAPGGRDPGALPDRVHHRGIHSARLLRGHLPDQAHARHEPGQPAPDTGSSGAGHLAAPPGTADARHCCIARHQVSQARGRRAPGPGPPGPRSGQAAINPVGVQVPRSGQEAA